MTISENRKTLEFRNILLAQHFLRNRILSHALQQPRVSALPADCLWAVLVCHPAQPQGAEPAAARCVLCLLRVVGLALPGADCPLHHRRLPRRYPH